MGAMLPNADDLRFVKDAEAEFKARAEEIEKKGGVAGWTRMMEGKARTLAIKLEWMLS